MTLPGNASVSDGVTLTEGDSDSVTISILEPNFDPVLISVTVVTGSAESGMWFREKREKEREIYCLSHFR